MSLAIYCELFVVYITWQIFLVTNSFYNLLKHLYWSYNGLYSIIVENRKPENYAKSAQVLKNLFGHRLDDFIEARESDFVLVHDRFESPEFVLRDGVTLYTVTESYAIFVQSKEGWSKPMHTYDFFILGQVASCANIIKVPLNHFNTLAESIPDDGAKIVFLQNQARCGGTLLTSIFKETGRCIGFNEPHVINAAVKYLYIDYVWHGEVAKRNLRNVVRMLCKPYKGMGEATLAYVIKPTVTSIVATELIQEAMPDAIQFFMYRDPVAVSRSIRREGQCLNTVKLTFYLPNVYRMIAPLFRLIGYCEVNFRGWTPAVTKDLEFGYRCACIGMYHIQQARKHGLTIHGIMYKDLVDHRDKMIRKFFSICNIPDELVKTAEAAMDRDSQANSPVSREKINKAMPVLPVVTPEFLVQAREMAKEFGVPDYEEFEDPSFRLPGTLMI